MNEASRSISVAVCTYNGARFLGQQLRSIVDQSMVPHQLVIADDGSSDSTVAVVQSFSALLATGEREIDVVFLAADSGPCGAAKNFGRAIAACTGDVIALADQDDVWHPDRLSHAVREFDRDESVLLVASDARLVNDDGKATGRSLFESLNVSADEIRELSGPAPVRALLRRNILAGMTFTFTSELKSMALPIPDHVMHDYWLALNAGLMGRMRVLDECLVDYRQHGSNVVGAHRQSRLARGLSAVRQPSNAIGRANLYGDVENLVVRHAERFSPSVQRHVIDKARFERARANLPTSKLRRIAVAASMVARGTYRAFSPNGNIDAIRDTVSSVANNRRKLGGR